MSLLDLWLPHALSPERCASGMPGIQSSQQLTKRLFMDLTDMPDSRAHLRIKPVPQLFL